MTDDELFKTLMSIGADGGATTEPSAARSNVRETIRSNEEKLDRYDRIIKEDAERIRSSELLRAAILTKAKADTDARELLLMACECISILTKDVCFYEGIKAIYR